VVGGRPRVPAIGDQPGAVGEIAAGDADVAFVGLGQFLHVVGDVLVENQPFDLVAIEAGGLNGAFGGMNDGAADIVLLILGDDLFLAVGDIDREQAEGVGIVVADHVERFVV